MVAHNKKELRGNYPMTAPDTYFASCNLTCSPEEKAELLS